MLQALLVYCHIVFVALGVFVQVVLALVFVCQVCFVAVHYFVFVVDVDLIYWIVDLAA